jgi:hypothetical protein
MGLNPSLPEPFESGVETVEQSIGFDVITTTEGTTDNDEEDDR